MGEPGRWFIGAATTAYTPESGFEDRPELAAEVERMARTFTGLGYRRAPGFGINLTSAEFQNRLRTFLISPDRRDDGIVAVYYTGHGSLSEGSLLLPKSMISRGPARRPRPHLAKLTWPPGHSELSAPNQTGW